MDLSCSSVTKLGYFFFFFFFFWVPIFFQLILFKYFDLFSGKNNTKGENIKMKLLCRAELNLFLFTKQDNLLVVH